MKSTNIYLVSVLVVFRYNCFPLGKISRFKRQFSIDIFPGPRITKVQQIDIRSNSNLYPPTNPLDNFAVTIAPIISMINKAEANLVSIPNNKAKPPITSRSPIGMNSSGGKLMD